MSRHSLCDADTLFLALENYNGDQFFSQEYAALLEEQFHNGLDLLLNQGTHGIETLFRCMILFYAKKQYSAHIFHLGQAAQLFVWMDYFYTKDAFQNPEKLIQHTCRQIEFLHDSWEDWKNPALCARTIRQIEQQYQKVRLKDLASHLGVNAAYLSRVISQNLRITFLDLLHAKRILAALDLFAQPEKVPLEQMAVDLGYSSAHYFYCVFKKYIGLTPSEVCHLMHL